MDEPKGPRHKLGYVECPTVAHIEAKYGVDLHHPQPTVVWDAEYAHLGQAVAALCAGCATEVLIALAETDTPVCEVCFAKLERRLAMAAQKGFRMGA
jgi:hypothetical protein